MKRFGMTMAALALAVFSFTPSTVAVAGGSSTLIVHPGNLQGWQPTASGTAATAFESGPATPPLPTGSGELRVGTDGNSAAQFRHPGYAGTMLNALSALSYSTYVDEPGTGGQAPYIILSVDHNGDGVADDLLFFEPLYQSGFTTNVPDQGPLLIDTWQTWNALTGGWYSVNGFAGTGPGANVRSLSHYVTFFPNATIVNTASGLGGLRLVAGFGAGAWNNFVGNIDNVTVGVGGTSTTYNFELAPSAALVTVGGRVLDGYGMPVSGAFVAITAPNGTVQSALTNAFGHYRFSDIATGSIYSVTVRAKGHAFAPRSVSVIDELTDLDFIAEAPEK